MTNDPTTSSLSTTPSASPHQPQANAMARPPLAALAAARDPVEALQVFFEKHPQLGLEFAAYVGALMAAGYDFRSRGDTLSLLQPDGRLLASLSWAAGLTEVMAPLSERVFPFVATVFDRAALHPRSLWDTFTAIREIFAGLKGGGFSNTAFGSSSPELLGFALAGLIASRAFHELDPKQQAEILLARAQVLGDQARRQLSGPMLTQAKFGARNNAAAILNQAIQSLRDASQLDPNNSEIRQLLTELQILAGQKLPKPTPSTLA
jgi:hypothetical protein